MRHINTYIRCFNIRPTIEIGWFQGSLTRIGFFNFGLKRREASYVWIEFIRIFKFTITLYLHWEPQEEEDAW